MKRLLIIVFLFFLIPLIGRVVPSIAKPAYAVDLTDSSQYGVDMDACRNGQMNVNCYVYLINQADYFSTICGIAPLPVCSSPNNTKFIPLLGRSSALGVITMGIDYMYQNRPADLGYWVQDTAVSLGFKAQPAYAQGTGLGFQGLVPLLPIWKAFRNIAYVILALVMIVVGFLVMVRKRIDPKTVVTVQNSIPRIVMALILITFSYAIVGLMIDLMYLVMGFVSVIFASAFPPTSAQQSFWCGGGGGIPIISDIQAFFNQSNLANPGLWDFFKAVFAPLAIAFNPACQAVITSGQGGSLVQSIAQGIGGAILFGLGGFIIEFILVLAYLFAFIRILLLLLNSYIQILLAVLIGPLQLLLDAFPGGNGFTSWIKNLVANLLPFPITAFMLLLAKALLFNVNKSNLWTAPFLLQSANVNLPFIGTVAVGGMGGIAEAIITLGIILTIPKVVKGIQESMKASGPFGIGGGGGGGAGSLVTNLSLLYYAQAMTPKVIKDRVAGMFGAGNPTEGGSH